MNSNDMQGVGATRIDRSYCYGDLVPVDADLVSVAFSCHLSYIVTFKAPTQYQQLSYPKSRPLFKTTLAIVNDKVFQARLSNSMQEWQQVKSFGVPVLTWWEVLVNQESSNWQLKGAKKLIEKESHT